MRLNNNNKNEKRKYLKKSYGNQIAEEKWMKIQLKRKNASSDLDKLME